MLRHFLPAAVVEQPIMSCWSVLLFGHREAALSRVAVLLVDTPVTYPWVRDFTADMPIKRLKPAVLEAVAKAGPGGCSALSLAKGLWPNQFPEGNDACARMQRSSMVLKVREACVFGNYVHCQTVCESLLLCVIHFLGCRLQSVGSCLTGAWYACEPVVQLILLVA